MKRIAVIMVLAVLCFNSIGYFMVHQYEKKRIKKEIKTRLKLMMPAEELVTFLFDEHNAKDFYWIHSKEFIYNGAMYDIVRVEVLSATAKKLYCISDHQETILFKNLRQLVNNSMHSNPAHDRVVNLLTMIMNGLYLTEVSVYSAPVNVTECKWYETREDYQSPFIQHVSPPPRKCFLS